MRVKSTQNISGTSQSKKSARKSSGQFSLPEENTTSSSSATLQAGPVAGIDALLALQEVDNIDVNARRKQAITHGDDILDVLEKLKVALLSGNISQSQLISLKKLIEQRPDYNEDPNLKDLLDHIDLRARVELAKLKVY